MWILKPLTGRTKWAARLGFLLVLGAAVGLVFAILPVLAAPGDLITPASSQGVTPVEEDLGGQPNDCAAVGFGSLYDFRIEDPATGSYTDTQSGFNVTFNLTARRVAGQDFLDYTVSGASVSGVIIKGGANSAFYDYISGNGAPGAAVSSDTNLHATKKSNGKLYSISHTSFCYDVVGTISGTKWHDHDADGTQDTTNEGGLSGWVITAFDSNGGVVGSDTTDANGDYTITNVPLGQTYRVCETTNSSGLPNNGVGFTWAWTQSFPDPSAGVCASPPPLANQEPGGHSFLMNASVEDIDFGNLRQVSIVCDPNNDVVVTLGGNGDPLSTVTLPAGCSSGVGANDPFISTFDVGRSADNDAWSQFVVFGGDPDSGQIVPQTIVWDPEDADYRDANGDECTAGTAGCSLVIPTTLVRLTPTGQLEPVVFCSTLPNNEPTMGTPDCLDSRSIAEGGSVPQGQIQLTENYLFLGDPPRFR